MYHLMPAVIQGMTTGRVERLVTEGRTKWSRLLCKHPAMEAVSNLARDKVRVGEDVRTAINDHIRRREDMALKELEPATAQEFNAELKKVLGVSRAFADKMRVSAP